MTFGGPGGLIRRDSEENLTANSEERGSFDISF